MSERGATTVWTCMSCGAIGTRQSCATCGREAMPGEWIPAERLQEVLGAATALVDRFDNMRDKVERGRSRIPSSPTETRQREKEAAIIDAKRADGYSDDEWVYLQDQVRAVISERGVAYTTDELRRAIEQRRRIRWGTLNGLLIVAHLDALAARVAELEEALRFYATASHTAWANDVGEIARAALAAAVSAGSDAEREARS